MNLYEGMYIFPEEMEEDAIEESIKKVAKEIERFGGNVKSTARLGKRKFARRIEKRDYGYYVVMTFELDGQKVQPLKKRYGLFDDLLRVQIVRAESEEPAAGPVEEKGSEVQSNG